MNKKGLLNRFFRIVLKPLDGEVSEEGLNSLPAEMALEVIEDFLSINRKLIERFKSLLRVINKGSGIEEFFENLEERTLWEVIEEMIFIFFRKGNFI